MSVNMKENLLQVPLEKANKKNKEFIKGGGISLKETSKSQDCKICGKILASLSSYYVHLKSHSTNKPYKCNICSFSFTRKHYLEVHLRTHTGERPFKCSTCYKSFTQKSSLNTHLRVHSGEKPYDCEFCDKSFAVKSYLDAHRWCHVGEGGNSVTCVFCGENFSTRAHATAHMRVHTNHRCRMCHRSFSKECYLLRHISRVHSKNLLSNNSINKSTTQGEKLTPIKEINFLKPPEHSYH